MRVWDIIGIVLSLSIVTPVPAFLGYLDEIIFPPFHPVFIRTVGGGSKIPPFHQLGLVAE